MISSQQCDKDGHQVFAHIVDKQPCAKAYPHLKATWARHYLFHDWLSECNTCTGPVLYADLRDVFFQDDPFGPGSPVVHGLQVYQVDTQSTTKVNFVGDALKKCKGLSYDNPMLCAG